MLPPLTHPERVASPSIRGYLFQTVGIARQWVELADDEILLCEGDEDADRFILAGGVVQDVTQYQFKDVGGTVSVRDSAVQESIFNFLRAFHQQSINGRRVRFVFTTSAARARQQTTTSSGASSHNVSLAIDVLKAWQRLPIGTERGNAIAELIEAVRKIVAAARPAPTVDATSTKAHGDYAELEAATGYLDSDATRWTDFIERVDWRLDQGAVRQQVNELEQALALDARTTSLPSRMLAERIVVKVLEASAQDEKNLRVLTRASFADVVSTSSDELSNWTALTKADRLSGWFDEIDTGYPAGEALREQFPRYSVVERARIEAAVVAAHALYEDAEAADRTCSRLFGYIDPDLLTTSEAQTMALDLRNRGIEQPNRPPFSTTGWQRTSDGDEADSQRWLRREGVPVNEEPNKRILGAVRALETVHKSLVDTANVEQLFDCAVRVTTLVEENAGASHPRVDCAWGEVAESLEKVVSVEACLAVEAIRARVWEIAAKVVECPSPRTTPAIEQQMDVLPSWGSPHARGTIGEVLVTLALVEPTRPVLDAIDRLAADDVGSVRYRVIACVGNLARVAPELVWRIANNAIREEALRSVLAVLAGWVLGALCVLDANRGAKLLGCLLNRVGEGDRAKDVHSAAYSLLCDIHLDGDDSRVASALVYECTLRPAEAGADVLLHRVRTSLAAGPIGDDGSASHRQRRRAQNILSLIVEHAKAALAELFSKHPTQMPEDAVSQGRVLVARLDKAAHEIYFASGAFEASQRQDKPEILDPRIRERFLDELAPTIEALAATGVPRVAHPVLQTLEYMLETNPRRAFLMVAAAVEAAKPHGYQFDSLAAGLIVKVCTRVLAEHRALLQEDVAIRDALLDILDVFVAVGWPEAQEITYGLQDIFR